MVCRKFVGPLPSNLEEYVTLVQKNFIYIIDTKILLNANNVLQLKMKKSNTSLSKAFTILCPHITSGVSRSSVAAEVQVDDMRLTQFADHQTGAKHEAGYDALMTWCIFAQSCNHLDINFSSHSKLMNEEEKLQLDMDLWRHS